MCLIYLILLEFTKEELRNLTIAFVVLTFCFSIATVGLNVERILSILPIVRVSVVIGSLLHELGHKFVAMKYGCLAEFKLWPLGLVIAVVSSFFGFVFASLGSLHISPENLSDEINGKISIAEPMANLGLALIFIAIAALIYPLKIHSNVFI